MIYRGLQNSNIKTVNFGILRIAYGVIRPCLRVDCLTKISLGLY